VVSDLIFKQSTLYLALVFVALAAIVSTKSCTTTAHASAARTVVQSAAARVGTIITHCAECPEMIPVRISLSGSPKDILVAKTELTWRQYMYIYDRAKCPIPRSIKGRGDEYDVSDPSVRDDYPLTSLKPVEIQCYVAALGKLTGKAYRLPTEAEWIAIARLCHPSGHLSLSSVAADQAHLTTVWIKGITDKEYARIGYNDGGAYDARERSWVGLVPVARYPSDCSGLYDLIGNAGELVSGDSDSVIVNPATGKRVIWKVVVMKGFGQRYRLNNDSFQIEKARDVDLITNREHRFKFFSTPDMGYRLVVGDR
jgi:Sulfatase-modifying factor enzyme 1